jgi:cysteinyl-tRNA synthetase
VNPNIRPIKITNTLTGQKEQLQTLIPGKLSLYTCGPTVYNFIHIGNLRTALVADTFYRYFKRVGYDVNYVRNYTDVDDKIIKVAADQKVPFQEVTRKYTSEVEKDFAVAGMLEPTHKPTVVEAMPDIVAMIEKLVANQKAYVIASGEVLYSIESFEGYGKLSHKLVEDLVAGVRADVRGDLSEKKRNPLDFSLWKPAKPGEPSWDSPWGKGRPGWHIECSAMSSRWIGDQIDVHHGAVDLIFPHHENEIAQSEGACGKAPFVKYWMHNAFLNLSKTKMSKSLGNVFTARKFLTEYSGEFARYMLIGVHYRSAIEFDEDLIEHTLIGLNRIYEAKAKAVEVMKQARARADIRAESAWGSFMASCEATRREIDESYANDFNMASALGALFTLIREFNRTLAEPLAAATPSAALGAHELVKILEEDIGGIFGIGRQDPQKALEDLARIKAARATAGGTALPTEAEILQAIEDRKAARAAKDFAKGDQIRKELDARGVLIKDSPTGTTWEYK